jgi:regulatory protein
MALTADPGGAPRITGILPDARHPDSVRLQVEGRTLLTVPAVLVERLNLRVGDRLAEDGHDTLCRAADGEAAFRTALLALARRPFAGRDLARRLVLKGHPPEAADQAVRRAERAGLVNDETFARHYVQTRAARGRGPMRLRRELTGMGVTPPLADRVLAEEMPAADQDARVAALARKRAAQLADLSRQDRYRRLLAFLARKGYRGTRVREIARAALGS